MGKNVTTQKRKLKAHQEKMFIFCKSCHFDFYIFIFLLML